MPAIRDSASSRTSALPDVEASDRDNRGLFRGRFRVRVAVLAGARMTATGISAVWMVVLARQLPVRAFGDLVLLLGLGLLFLVINDFGLPLALTDAVAARPETARDVITRALHRRLSLGTLSASLVAAAYLVSASDRNPIVPLVYAVSMLATTIHTTAAAYFRGRSSVRAESINEVVSRTIVLLGGGWWLLHGGGVVSAVAMYALVDTGSALVLGGLAWKATAGASEPADHGTLSLRKVAPVALAASVGVIYYRVDLWLVALRLGPRDVALYGSAYRVVEGLLLGASAVAAMSVPYLAKVAPDERMRRLGRLVVLGLVMTMPLAVGVAAAGGWGMRLVFGAPYASSGGVLRILVLAIVPSVVVTILGPVAFLRGRTRAATAFATVLVLNIVLNVALLPVLGVQAAAWATLLCQMLLAGLLWRSMARWVLADRV